MLHELACDYCRPCLAHFKSRRLACSLRTRRMNLRAMIMALWLSLAMLAIATPALAAITLSSESASLDASGLDFFNLASDHQTASDNTLFTTFDKSIQATTHGH